MLSYCLEFAAISLVIVQWASNANSDGNLLGSLLILLVYFFISQPGIQPSIVISFNSPWTWRADVHNSDPTTLSGNFLCVNSNCIFGQHRLHVCHCVLPWPYVCPQARPLCRVGGWAKCAIVPTLSWATSSSKMCCCVRQRICMMLISMALCRQWLPQLSSRCPLRRVDDYVHQVPFVLVYANTFRTGLTVQFSGVDCLAQIHISMAKLWNSDISIFIQRSKTSLPAAPNTHGRSLFMLTSVGILAYGLCMLRKLVQHPQWKSLKVSKECD